MRIAALDVGGTAIKSCVWNGKEIEEFREWDTKASEGGGRLMERVKSILHSYGQVEAVGISTAGQVDISTGSIHYANENIPGYTGMPVQEILEQEFGVPVAVENDVNAAALGEMYFGAAKGLSDFLCLTYGTGVGGAIVAKGEIWRGSSHAGGSFGGILIHPEAQKPGEIFSGCYEKYASVPALIRRVKAIEPELDNGHKIFARIYHEDILKAIDGWIDEMVYGLVTLIHCFNPSHILLGGGILAQPYIIEEVRRKVALWTSPNMASVDIRQTGLGNRAGLMGAAYLAGNRQKDKKCI